MSTRAQHRRDIEEHIDHRPNSPWARRVRLLGIEREVDLELLYDAVSALDLIDFRRYPTYPRVKDTISDARVAVRHALDTFVAQVSDPDDAAVHRQGE